MDKIFFRRLSLAASIGILPQERKHKQTLLIDLEFSIDAKKVESLADTINYALVREKILEITNAQHYDLLETLAEKISQQLMDQFKITWLHLEISKPDIFADIDAVGISIERSA